MKTGTRTAVLTNPGGLIRPFPSQVSNLALALPSTAAIWLFGYERLAHDLQCFLVYACFNDSLRRVLMLRLLMRKQNGRLIAFTTVGIVALRFLRDGLRGRHPRGYCRAMVLLLPRSLGAAWAGQQRSRVMRAVQPAAVFGAIAPTIIGGIFPQEVARGWRSTPKIFPFRSKVS